MLIVLDQIKAVEHMKPYGYMDDIINNGILRVENGIGEVIDIPDHIYWSLVKKYSPETFNQRISLYSCGVGCQLKRILSWFGIKDSGSCNCNSYASKMDAWGPDGCYIRMDEIIEHLRDAAKTQGLLFFAPAVKMLVRQAIDLAKKEIIHKSSVVK